MEKKNKDSIEVIIRVGGHEVSNRMYFDEHGSFPRVWDLMQRRVPSTMFTEIIELLRKDK